MPAGEAKVKVTCESCGARFVVRDPRVKGHRFRATCKRCGSLIVGTAEAHAAVTAEPKPKNGEGRRLAATASVAAAEVAPEQWYIVKRGKPKGPYSREELRDALLSGQLAPKTYVWRNGDAEWRRAGEVPELEGDAPDGDHVPEAPRPGDEPSEASTHFFQAPQSPEEELDPEDEPTRIPRAGDRARDGSMEVEVTRLVAARRDELSSKLTRLPDPAVWQAQAQAPRRDPIFGSAPGRLGQAEFGGPAKKLREGAAAAAAAEGMWAPVPRRPAILPAPSRRHTLAGAGFAPPAPAPAVAPPDAEPVAALLAAAAAASTHAPAAASAGPLPFGRPVAATTIADPPHALSWVPNPVPLNLAGQKPTAGPLLLPKPPTFWTPAKIALIAGVPVGLAIVAIVVTLLLMRRDEPPAPRPAVQAAEAQPDAQVTIAIKPDPATAPPRPGTAAAVAPSTKTAPRAENAAGGSASAEKPAGGTAVSEKPTPRSAANATSAPRKKPETKAVTVAVRTEVKRIAPRRSSGSGPARSAPSGDDEDALLAGAVSSPRAAPKKRGAAAGGADVDADALLSAGGGGLSAGGGAKPRRASKGRSAGAGESGGPALASDVDADALLSAGGGGLSAGGGGGGAARATPSKLSRDQIRSTMGKLRGHVKSCFAAQPGAKGIVEIATTVQPDGSASGRAVGSFAGTSAGSCAAQGVSRLRFPRFSGPTMRFSYPFAL